MNNYIFITREGDPLPIAGRLKDEGKNVVVGMVQDDDSGASKEKNQCRLQLYDGILQKQPSEKVMAWMKTIPNKEDWFVMLDYGNLWPQSERILAMGFRKGIFPTKEGYELENDRQKGKAFAKEHYPELKVAPVAEFTSVEDSIRFLDQNPDKIFVLKSEGSNAETVVPSTEDPGLAHRQVIGALRTESKDYEKGGFTLEEKIHNPVELSPVMLFWDGEPLFSLVELENKQIGSGNIGRLSGGCQNLTLQTPLDCELNRMAFPPVIYEMARKQPGIGIYDAGLLFDGKDFYFTEFCSQRWGWDGIFSEIAMSSDNARQHGTSRHFDLISEGRNPLNWKFGAAVRIFQSEPDPKRPDVYEDGYTMDWLDSVSERLFFYCIRGEAAKSNESQFVSVGYRKDVGTATGAANTMEYAVNLAYEAASGFAMTGAYYRPKFDFLSRRYFTSILNRYDFLMNSGLI